jgi:hypothetical protein
MKQKFKVGEIKWKKNIFVYYSTQTKKQDNNAFDYKAIKSIARF